MFVLNVSVMSLFKLSLERMLTTCIQTVCKCFELTINITNQLLPPYNGFISWLIRKYEIKTTIFSSVPFIMHQNLFLPGGCISFILPKLLAFIINLLDLFNIIVLINSCQPIIYYQSFIFTHIVRLIHRYYLFLFFFSVLFYNTFLMF